MNVVRLWPCLLAVVLVAPTALAAPSLAASAFTVDGTTTVTGDASALFVLAQRAGFAWDLRASSAEVERFYANYTAVGHPARADTYLYTIADPYRTETIALGAVEMRSLDVLPGGGLLALAPDAAIDARSEGLVQIRSEVDPAIRQLPPSAADVSTDEGDNGFIRWDLEGDYLNATFAHGVATIAGDITLVLYGPAYEVFGADGSQVLSTGERETSPGPGVIKGTDERHTLRLQDAVLHVRAPEGITLYTRSPQVALAGDVRAEGAEGALLLGDAELAASDAGEWSWSGDATLALQPLAGRVVATTPEPLVASGGAVVAKGPLLVPLVVGLALALALALALVLVARRRAAGDLEAALLAMEERRWEDALPHLSVLAKRQPGNAGVQIDRALCLEQVGRFGDAARAFEAALRAAPQHAEAHFYYARTLAKMRESEAARVHLEAALERDPRLAEMARRESVLRGL